MEFESLKKRLEGCYVTVPTMFRDSDLGLDLNATRRHVRFLMDRGINEDNAVLLAGGAAGDFSTMALDDRISVAKAIVEEVDGKIPVAMGAQTTNTMELCRLVKSAQDLGADFVQISPPFYFEHTEDDFYEFVQSAAETAIAAIKQHQRSGRKLKEVVFCCFDEENYQLYDKLLNKD